MQLLRGNFLVNNINEINYNDDENIIDLAYMGAFEYEGNAVPISRMFIEYNKDSYSFYPIDIYNKDKKQMFIFINKEIIDEKLINNPNYLIELANHCVSRNFSLWEYINKETKDLHYNFWWNIESDYFIFFGEEKKNIINYFINNCYEHDGGHQEIKRKLLKVGYKL